MAYRIVEITKPAECHVNNHQHFPNQRHSAFLKMQINLSEDFKNCLWNKIIRQKIDNSSRNLAVLGCDGVKEIESFVSQVRYAIVRSYIIKAIISTGFHCALGINHHNEYNNFNLADDLIEPWR